MLLLELAQLQSSKDDHSNILIEAEESWGVFAYDLSGVIFLKDSDHSEQGKHV